MNVRQNYLTLIVGTKGTGKTTAMKRILQSTSKKIIVLDVFDHTDWRHLPMLAVKDIKRWVNGNVRVVTDEPELALSEIAKYVYNSIIVYEDANQYFESHLSKDVKRIIIQSKQKNNDIFVMYHSLGEVAKYFRTMYNRILLFKTKDTISECKKYSNAKGIESALNYCQMSPNQFVNQIVEN